LPRNFRVGRLSTISLVRASGDLSAPQVLTREAVLAVLRLYPSLVEDWEVWSGDQRTDRGWFFEPEGAGYLVGYHSTKGEFGERELFSDRFEACAAFIVRHIRAVAQNAA